MRSPRPNQPVDDGSSTPRPGRLVAVTTADAIVQFDAGRNGLIDAKASGRCRVARCLPARPWCGFRNDLFSVFHPLNAASCADRVDLAQAWSTRRPYSRRVAQPTILASGTSTLSLLRDPNVLVGLHGTTRPQRRVPSARVAGAASTPRPSPLPAAELMMLAAASSGAVRAAATTLPGGVSGCAWACGWSVPLLASTSRSAEALELAPSASRTFGRHPVFLHVMTNALHEHRHLGLATASGCHSL